MATRKYQRKSKPRRKHTRHQRGGESAYIFEINCHILGIDPNTLLTESKKSALHNAKMAHANAINDLLNNTKSYNKTSESRINAAYNNIVKYIESRGHVAHPPKSQRPATPTPRGKTLKANPMGLLSSQSERRLPIRRPDSSR